MKISSYNRQKDVKISAASVKKTVKLALEFHGVDPDEIAIHFVTVKAICKLHADFFDDPEQTDCISFPYDKEFLGEVFICPKTALEYVAVNGGDIYNEITLYLIHGILHLLGFDDVKSKDRAEMRLKEKELMDYLSFKCGLMSA